jgi:hypothetical protein
MGGSRGVQGVRTPPFQTSKNKFTAVYRTTHEPIALFQVYYLNFFGLATLAIITLTAIAISAGTLFVSDNIPHISKQKQSI